LSLINTQANLKEGYQRRPHGTRRSHNQENEARGVMGGIDLTEKIKNLSHKKF
jgi:hypothetical protein